MFMVARLTRLHELTNFFFPVAFLKFYHLMLNYNFFLLLTQIVISLNEKNIMLVKHN